MCSETFVILNRVCLFEFEIRMDLFRIVFLLLACLAAKGFCAERVDARLLLQHVLQRRQLTSNSVTSHRFKRDAAKVPTSELTDAMSLDDDTKLDVVTTTTTVQGTQLIKMQETFKGRVVPDGVVTLETDEGGHHVLDASGTVYRNIDLERDAGQLESQGALTLCLRHNFDEDLRESITHTRMEAEVLFDDEMDPYPAYLVQYLVQVVDKEERRPTCIINARDSRVIMSWDALETCVDCEATGIGGNEKIGKIRYGDLQRCLDLRRENGVCYLENKYVRVINNNFTYLENNEESEYIGVASYNCEEIDDDVNGAYSPLLDALFYGTVVGKMYEDWYNMTPLGDMMTFRVHFGANFSNAMWNGFECAFGDGGYTYMYPLVSLDIVGHEVGHGITEKNSELYYYEQWGGINEAFSDMAGETAEAYLDEADWVMGVDITYKGVPPLRFFENPETDNMSISHVDNYTAFLNPHYGSGVYNRVFYILVQEYGLHIKDVFGVFLHANRMYWHHMSSYVRAACDVMKAAYDLGQDGSKFRKAFGEVGITVCDIEDHVLGLKSGENYTNIKVAKDISPTFFFGVPGQYAASVEVSARSAQGDVNIVVSNKTWGDEESNVRVYAEGLGSVRFDVPDNSSMLLSITLSTDSATPLTNVTLMALFTCVRNFSYNGTGVGYLYWHWKDCTIYEEEEGEGGEVEEDTDSPEDEGSDKIEKEEVEAEFANQTHISASGHVFNFFNSFVIMLFPKNK